MSKVRPREVRDLPKVTQLVSECGLVFGFPDSKSRPLKDCPQTWPMSLPWVG